MKFLQTARRRARQCRNSVGISAPELLERTERYLWEKYRIELVAVDAAVIDGGRAELRPDEGCLYYDETLNETSEKKLLVIAHEVGHLELHPRLTRGCREPDPVYGSMYGSAGADSLTRYNSRSREEAEADAFAAEFLCPSDEAFRLWLTGANKTAEQIAEALGAPIFIVYSQLAEALYQKVFGAENVPQKQQFDEKKCDPKQEAAAIFRGAPVLVDAGPGTGKTKTLVRRIEFLLELEEEKIEPENFLVVTFSNEAAIELHERIEAKFGEEIAARLTITTFHGFGLTVLQHHGQFQDVDANAYILDNAAQVELLSEIIGKATGRKIVNLKDTNEAAAEAARHINFLKQRLVTPVKLEQTLNAWRPADDTEKKRKRNSEQLLEIYKEYEKVKDERQRLDFADLILKSINIFRAQPQLAAKYREKYRAVLVDEYQDVSRATAKLLQQICGENNPPWVVGDKRQSIFGFCGAAPDNVDEFANDFPGAVKFTLEINYRACEEIVETARQMASLMFKDENSAPSAGAPSWRAHEDNPKAVFHPAVVTAIANSDRAEYDAIADQVKNWVSKKVPLADIAVLSRRNVDVRDIVLALSARKIPAIASGVVTADGAAGDLAAILTFADKPGATLPRLAYSLGRGRFDYEIIDKVIENLREAGEDFANLSNVKIQGCEELVKEIERAFISLEKDKFAGDAFSAMCAFLFDGSDYLRRILASQDEARRLLTLGEVIAALMRAAIYRFSHRGAPPASARKRFAEHFRDSLASSNAPCLSPPAQKGVPAVKVMTCHAAKGLEFPFVVVAGQAHSKRSDKTDYEWLPLHLLPKADADKNQTDSVLFVGATRARQMLVVSCATTSSGLLRAEKRIVTPLLKAWREAFEPREEEWTLPVEEYQEVEIPAIWGGKIDRPVSARKLDKDECAVGIYLHEATNMDFPVEEKSLYPIFYSIVRRAMNEIVKQAFKQQKAVEKADAVRILLKEWNESVKPDHTQHDLFLAVAKDYTQAFAEKFVPEKGNVKFLDLSLEEAGGEVLLDLVSAYQIDSNPPIAVLFRPEVFKEEDLRENGLLWSALSGKKRASFALLKTVESNLQPKIFSGEDSRFYDYQWNSRPKNLDVEIFRLKEKRAALAENRFVTLIKDYNCKKCPLRIGCPHWIKSSISF
jgi:superfamily I DNA/RNA helicase/Zn-dependent peptidase ImmA (M78 family)